MGPRGAALPSGPRVTALRVREDGPGVIASAARRAGAVAYSRNTARLLSAAGQLCVLWSSKEGKSHSSKNLCE